MLELVHLMLAETGSQEQGFDLRVLGRGTSVVKRRNAKIVERNRDGQVVGRWRRGAVTQDERNDFWSFANHSAVKKALRTAGRPTVP